MNSERSKLRTKEAHEQTTDSREQAAQAAAQEFATVEDLLRYDSEQNPVPEEVGARLNNSIAAEPKAKPSSWWRALFGS